MPLFILFFTFPLVETWLLFQFSSEYGFFYTLVLIFLTAFFGSRLAKQQGFSILKQIKSEIGQGITPNATLLEGLLILVSGIVLLLPGLMSDFIGLALLIPPIRKKFVRLLPKILKKFAKFKNGSSTGSPFGASFGSGFGQKPGPDFTPLEGNQKKKPQEDAEFEVIDD